MPSKLQYMRTLGSNNIVDNLDVIGAAPKRRQQTAALDLTPGVNELGKDNFKMRRETL